MSFIKKEPREMLTSKGAKTASVLKRGFGIVEVLVAAAVLGFLYVAVLNLQSGNRESLLRIRGRDGATEVAQNIIDSLGSLGLATLSDNNPDLFAEDGSRKPLVLDPITRTWKAQPGAIQYDITVTYNAEVTISPDSVYTATATSMLLEEDSTRHVYAKRLDVKVSWPFKNSIQSISVSGVIR
jgi:type II secretory pathway pseudopilin PulG